MEDRLTELETKLSFAEDLIEELNRVVFRQQEQIDLMQQQITMLHQQVQAVTPEDKRDIREEIPPHY